MRAAVIQLASTQDIARNRERMVSLVDGAVGEGARLVVLPEATQLAFGTRGEVAAEQAEALDGAFVSKLSSLAASSQATIVAGMFERGDGADRPFNTTVVVGPTGLLGAYRKIHLYDAFGYRESDSVQPGPRSPENLCIVELDGFSVGVLTCFDLRFPELATALFERGAKALVIGAAWVAGDRKLEQWSTLLAARAIETTCFVVAAAQPGPRYCGHTQIVHPDGRVLAEAPTLGDQVLSAPLDLDELAAVRRRLPLRELR
jgi:predicted amidohydrolase